MTLRDKLRRSASIIITFFEYRIIVKMNCHKLKFFIDIIFIIVEKVFSKLNKLLLLYIDSYLETIQKEIRLANISESHKILNLGCGAIPATCILLAKKTNATITGIEKNLKSVKSAKIISTKLKLDKRIEIKHSNAMNAQLHDFDIIIIANGINPYYKVLKRVATDMKDDAMVILRTFSQRNGETADKDNFLKHFYILGNKISCTKSGFLISVLLYKKGRKTKMY